MTTKNFQTSDLYLSAALQINGFKLIDIKSDGKKGIFVFQDRGDRFQITKDYFSGTLTGSLKAFANAWGDLKNLVTQIDKE